MKYVIFSDGCLLYPVIFPEHVVHKQIIIARATPVSAGFCKIESYGIEVDKFSHSESLGIGPHPDDYSLLNSAYHNNSDAAKYLAINYNYKL